MKVSKFQFVQVEKDRIVVRFYNEEKDCFEKVCACEEASVCADTLLRADSNYYFAYEGKLYPLGEGEVVLFCGCTSHCLRMFDVSQLKPPFKAIFVYQSFKQSFICAQSYELAENSVRITTPNGRTKVYEYTCGVPKGKDRQGCLLVGRDE